MMLAVFSVFFYIIHFIILKLCSVCDHKVDIEIDFIVPSPTLTFFLKGAAKMSYPPPSGGFPMYGPPPVPGGGSQYPAPGGPPLGFGSYAGQPSYIGATPGVSACSFYLPSYM